MPGGSFVDLFEEVFGVEKVYHKKLKNWIYKILNLTCEFMNILGRPAKSSIEMFPI